MASRPWLALLLLAAVSEAQESRPAPTSETRPTSSIYVIGTTESGDLICRIDESTLGIAYTYGIDGSPSYAKLTPDGDTLILTTTPHRTINRGGATITALDPVTFEPRWTHVSDCLLTWRGRIADVLVTDPSLPDTVAIQRIQALDFAERPGILNWSVDLVRSSGLETIVQVPEWPSKIAIWKPARDPSVFAVTARNEVWAMDAGGAESRRVTSRQLAPSKWLQPQEEGGLLISAFVLARSENRAVCFGRTGECFVVDLASGTTARRDLSATLLRGNGIAFARRSERTGRILVATEDDVCGGYILVLLDAELRETATIAIKDDPFIDAMFSADGTRVTTLTADGWLRIHDGTTLVETKRGKDRLPFLRGSMYCASIAGWR